jgi:hypothetical protein
VNKSIEDLESEVRSAFMMAAEAVRQKEIHDRQLADAQVRFSNAVTALTQAAKKLAKAPPTGSTTEE